MLVTEYHSYKQRIFVLLYSSLTVTSVLGCMSHVVRPSLYTKLNSPKIDNVFLFLSHDPSSQSTLLSDPLSTRAVNNESSSELFLQYHNHDTPGFAGMAAA